MKPPSPSKNLVDLWFEEFSDWVAAARSNAQKIKWKFVIDDCTQFISWKKEKFDVITTSNLIDHVGLMTLLTVTRPMMRDFGVLLTTSFLWWEDADSPTEYIKVQLQHLDQALWSGMFGFRPVGFEESELLPESSSVQSFSWPFSA